MRTLITWMCMILGMGVCGLVVSGALSWERWVAPARMARKTALAQEIWPATSPVLQSRFARPAPMGWAVPSLVEARVRQDEPWRPRLAQLGLPVAVDPSRLRVEPVGEAGPSMGRDAGAPLPRVRLVKDVLAAMPDKCDERLFGTWYCGISCLYDDCEATGGVFTLDRSIDPDGYERIHHRQVNPHGDNFLFEWKVERKWGASISNSRWEKGKLIYASCNGRTDAGQSRLAINSRNQDGSDQRLVFYWVDGANRTMWVEYYKIRLEGDKIQKKRHHRDKCRREIKRYE